MTATDLTPIVANLARARRASPKLMLATGWRTYLFLGYNVALMIVSAVALILLLVRSDYLPSSEVAEFMGEAAAGEQSGEGATADDTSAPAADAVSEAVAPDQNSAAQPAEAGFFRNPGQAVLFFTLATMLTAGCAGGVLCNLRGIFKYYRDEGGFRTKFVWPFVIRPAIGAAVGLFVFFIASFFSEALSAGAADTSAFAWASLKGRLPLVGLAILAGFGSQEFMERMKEVAKATFAVAGQDADQVTIQEIASWETNQAPLLVPPGADELILLYTTGANAQPFESRIISASDGDTVQMPNGAGKAVSITGGTLPERQAVAEQLKQIIDMMAAG